jgi:hypothetical protein
MTERLQAIAAAMVTPGIGWSADTLMGLAGECDLDWKGANE